MFAKNRVSRVQGNSFVTANSGMSPDQAVAAYASRRTMKEQTEVDASVGFFGGGSGAANSMSVNGFWQSNYQYMMTGIIPADPALIDTSNLSLFYRDIYLFDNTAGSAVDIQSSFPFSTWELRGLEHNELKIYDDALARLNIMEMMPQISTAYLVDGFFCGSLVFDPKTKQFMDTLIYDALQCAVIPSPFYNADPVINVRVSQATQQYMNNAGLYATQYINSMPHQFVEMLRSGAFELDPVTTLFVQRRSLTDRAYVSYLHRILPMYLIEKTLFRGTLVEAQRRQRAMTHIQAGDDTWTPSTEELHAYVAQFQMAEFDPLGGWVSTRNAVQATDLRPGGDFWKWTDMADILVPYKLRALGISESFLSGDASYAAAESAYSTFLESQNAYRMHLTNRVFYTKLFPLVAVVNGLYKDASKKAQTGKIIDYLYNASNRNNLKIPEIHWHKSLEAKGEDNMFDLLEKASEKGVPVPLKMWMAAANMDPEALLRDLRDDTKLRAQLEQFTGKNTSHESEDADGDDDMDFGVMGGDEGDDNKAYASAIKHLRASMRKSQARPTVQSVAAGGRQNRALLARDFGESGEMFEVNKSGSGKKYVYNQRAATTKANERIARIHSQAQKDKNYRIQLRQRNKEELGTTMIPGCLDLPIR